MSRLHGPKYVDDPERERVTGSGLAANTTYSLVDANWFLGVGKIRSVSSYPLSQLFPIRWA